MTKLRHCYKTVLKMYVLISKIITGYWYWWIKHST